MTSQKGTAELLFCHTLQLLLENIAELNFAYYGTFRLNVLEAENTRRKASTFGSHWPLEMWL